ncbi:MAG TPA: 6-phosphogluconolactonase, partial [Candidatus Saccharimonadia bacterium]
MVLQVYPDQAALSEQAAKQIIALANQAVADHGSFYIALAGGSTPQRLYSILASVELRSQTDWSKWQFFWSDERLVPLDDEYSNFHLADSALLSKLDLGASQVHPVSIEGRTSEEIAATYEQEIRGIVQTGADTVPRFDLILLGLGSDGHTASLFPGQPSLDKSQHLVVASPAGTLPPPVDRITFSLRTINAAHHVMILVSGSA